MNTHLTTSPSHHQAPALAAGPNPRALARIVGGLLLLQMAGGVFGEMIVRRPLIVRGDVTKTAENILESERLFRTAIAGDLVTSVAVLTLTWGLYVLLRPVNKHLALLGAFFRITENAVLCGVTIGSLVALRLLSGADYLMSFEPRQLHGLVRLALGAQGLGMNVAFVLLGLGSSIFAYLLLKSRYVPKVLAVWGIFSALLLSVGTLAIIVFPELGAIGLAYMMPMGLYEVGLGLWLLVKGVRATGVGQSG